MPLATANEAVHALLPTHVDRAETSAHDRGHRAISRASVDEQPRTDHDGMYQDRIAHQLGFADRTDVSQDEPQANEHYYAPGDHRALLASTICCTTTVNAPIA